MRQGVVLHLPVDGHFVFADPLVKLDLLLSFAFHKVLLRFSLVTFKVLDLLLSCLTGTDSGVVVVPLEFALQNLGCRFLLELQV